MYKLHISLLRAASEGFCQSKYQSQVSTGSARDRSCCSRFLGKIKWLLKFAKPIWKVRAPSSITSSNFVFSDNLSLFTDADQTFLFVFNCCLAKTIVARLQRLVVEENWKQCHKAGKSQIGFV